MARIIIGLSVLLLSFLIMSPFEITLSKPSAEAMGTPEPCQFGQSVLASNGTGYQKGGNGKQLQIAEHKIQTSDIQRLKQKIGVYTLSENYSESVCGYGTGWRPPTEEEWAQLVNNGYVVDKISFAGTISTPSVVDHSKEPWFPPIGNQGQENCCVCWAVGYYMKTYQEASEHSWNLSGAVWDGTQPSVEYQDRIISPAFIYNLVSGGVDLGSWSGTAINLICSIGACSWEQMPYNPGDYATWPSEEAWREAPLYRGASSGYHSMGVTDDAGLASLKTWIASGNLAALSFDASKIAYSDIWGIHSHLTSNDALTLDNYAPPFDYHKLHEVTIVGYDDSFSYTEKGQTRFGALKIANSWGVGGGWENVPDGYFWISYNVMKQWIQSYEFYEDRIGYKPELVASFRITHSKRGECDITVGVGSQTKNFNQYILGGDQPFCPNNILLDITEFEDAIPNVYGQQFYLKVYDGGGSATGTINKFAVEYSKSADPPISTVNGGDVYAYVTLSPLKTNWRTENEVSSDNDFLDGKVSLATDNNGCLYMAYDDWYPAIGHYAVFVRRSVDGGRIWSTITTASDSTHDVCYPSIAIDPSNNNIFVAVEREWTPNDHDILVWRCVNGMWSWSPVANTQGSDDRFPSITSEYEYGGADWQYISYEYVYTYNDRDLMFAKSTNQGATWSIQKLHGNFPDYNVHAQTCITNAEGNIYIAYKWGADYDSPCGIRVDRSTDFGNTWTQFTDVDGLPNGCSYPSIVATHGGSTVMVAFQYAWSASDTDVWYSYSADKGTTWVKGRSLFASGLEDEKQPELTVDGGGTTGTNIRGYFHVACKVGSYVKYAETIYSSPSSWSSSSFVSNRWVGKSIAIATQYRNTTAEFHPYIAWNDERTNNIYCTTIGHVHNLNDGLRYDSIQEAINANETHDGDSILAESRTYYADNSNGINISKAVNLIGENLDDTIVDGENSTLNAFYVNATSFSLKNFTICHSGNGIFIESCSNSTIYRNNITENSGFGVSIYLSSNSMVYENNLTNDSGGVCLDSCSNNSIFENNLAINHYFGIRLNSSSNSTICGNNVTSSGDGIDLDYSWNNTVCGNNLTANSVFGVCLYSSLNNTVSGNNVAANIGVGIFLDYSSNNTVSANKATANNNGIDLYSSSYDSVSGNTITANNGEGLYLYSSSNNSIVENNITANNEDGIGLWESSSYNIISGNNITNDSCGIKLSSCSNSSVSGNKITNNGYGIHLDSSSSNSISGNNITSNDYYGIELDSFSSYNSISGNNITENNDFGVFLDSSNYNSVSGNNITNNLCGIFLDYSSGNSMSGNSITNNYDGIDLGDSSLNTTISGNNITANSDWGVGLWRASNNTVSGNDITDNRIGIYTYNSSSNRIFHNNFVNNNIQVSYSGSANVWDDGYSSGGNYWSDYHGTDWCHGPSQNVFGSDGIGDQPYVIDAQNQDNYPLMTAGGSLKMGSSAGGGKYSVC